MSEPKDLSAEATEGGSTGVNGMSLWKLVTVVGSDGGIVRLPLLLTSYKNNSKSCNRNATKLYSNYSRVLNPTKMFIAKY